MGAMKNLPVWQSIGLACLWLFSANCSAEPEEELSPILSEEDLHQCYLEVERDDLKQVFNCLVKGLEPESRYLFSGLHKDDYKWHVLYFPEGHAPGNSKWKGNVAAIDHVVRYGRPKIMEMLLKAGVNPNYRNIDGVPVLIQALDRAYRSDAYLSSYEKELPPRNSRAVAFALLDFGADPNAYWELLPGYPRTALSYAAEYNDLEMVERLIELGADVNAPEQSNLRPLSFSEVKGHVELAKYLIKRGAKTSSVKDPRCEVKVECQKFNKEDIYLLASAVRDEHAKSVEAWLSQVDKNFNGVAVRKMEEALRVYKETGAVPSKDELDKLRAELDEVYLETKNKTIEMGKLSSKAMSFFEIMMEACNYHVMDKEFEEVMNKFQSPIDGYIKAEEFKAWRLKYKSDFREEFKRHAVEESCQDFVGIAPLIIRKINAVLLEREKHVAVLEAKPRM